MLEYEYLIRQRNYLLDISRALTAQLSLNEVLRRILRSATEMLRGKAGLIALAETESDTFQVRASVGIDPALMAASTDAALSLSRGIPSLAFGTYEGNGTHTLHEQVDLDSLTTGLKRLALTVLVLAGQRFLDLFPVAVLRKLLKAPGQFSRRLPGSLQFSRLQPRFIVSQIECLGRAVLEEVSWC